MSAPAQSFDLGGLRLASGEGRRMDLEVVIDPFTLGEERYTVAPEPLAVRLDVSRTTGEGYALRLRFASRLCGPCMRCLAPAEAGFDIEAREISQPGAGDELDSPYVERAVLDLGAWARDALALALPRAILCRADCAGLCPQCGADLNVAGAGHRHDPPPDPRWAKLSELKFDE